MSIDSHAANSLYIDNELIAAADVAHARRGPRGHQISRIEGHDARRKRDDFGNGLGHAGRVGVLAQLIVGPELNSQIMRFGYLVSRHEPRPDRREPVIGLSRAPIRLAAVGDVDIGRVAEDVLPSGLRGNMLGGLADHKSKPGFHAVGAQVPREAVRPYRRGR